MADVDNMDESENRIVLMTLHSAKGLEFPYVYLSGLEDGLFPSSMSIMSDDKDAVEEERRLCYVGITRAREKLTLTMARQRMTNGETRYSRASRFVEEIPAWLLEQEEQPSVFGRAAGRSWEAAHPLPLRTEALEKRLRPAGAEPAPASRFIRQSFMGTFRRHYDRMGSCVGRRRNRLRLWKYGREPAGRGSQHIWRETQCVCLKDSAGCPLLRQSIFRTKSGSSAIL